MCREQVPRAQILGAWIQQEVIQEAAASRDDSFQVAEDSSLSGDPSSPVPPTKSLDVTPETGSRGHGDEL